MARKSFEQTVDRIRQLDASEGKVAFEMGDEVLEQAPMGRDGANNESGEVLARLAAETGVEYEVWRTDATCRAASSCRTCSRSAWAVYRQIAYVSDEPERHQLLGRSPTRSRRSTWTVLGARRRASAGRSTRSAPTSLAKGCQPSRR